MKRSRTCMNLVELDAPAAPKRTCSLPNLAWNGSSSNIIPSSRQSRDTLLFFQQHAASTLSRGACEGFTGLSCGYGASRLPGCGLFACSLPRSGTLDGASFTAMSLLPFLRPEVDADPCAFLGTRAFPPAPPAERTPPAGSRAVFICYGRRSGLGLHFSPRPGCTHACVLCCGGS